MLPRLTPTLRLRRPANPSVCSQSAFEIDRLVTAFDPPSDNTERSILTHAPLAIDAELESDRPATPWV